MQSAFRGQDVVPVFHASRAMNAKTTRHRNLPNSLRIAVAVRVVMGDADDLSARRQRGDRSGDQNRLLRAEAPRNRGIAGRG